MSDLMLRVWTKVHIHTQPNDSLSASHMKAPAGTRCHQRIVHNTQLNKLAIQVRDMECGTTCISHARGSRRKSSPCRCSRLFQEWFHETKNPTFPIIVLPNNGSSLGIHPYAAAGTHGSQSIVHNNQFNKVAFQVHDLQFKDS
mmetsp:Transcript_71527/g.118418  ORF Transcript_71527/g.118418 Transcript_71527/m.118418 type:complete len:143 (-) Transcript_71527:322-750(-)